MPCLPLQCGGSDSGSPGPSSLVRKRRARMGQGTLGSGATARARPPDHMHEDTHVGRRPAQMNSGGGYRLTVPLWRAKPGSSYGRRTPAESTPRIGVNGPCQRGGTQLWRSPTCRCLLCAHHLAAEITEAVGQAWGLALPMSLEAPTGAHKNEEQWQGTPLRGGPSHAGDRRGEAPAAWVPRWHASTRSRKSQMAGM